MALSLFTAVHRQVVFVFISGMKPAVIKMRVLVRLELPTITVKNVETGTLPYSNVECTLFTQSRKKTLSAVKVSNIEQGAGG